MATAERTVACGLCQAAITEAVFRAGGARAIRGAVYCASCAPLYEKALAETAAWRGTLKAGAQLSCARCGAAVPLEDVRDEHVLRHEGKLSCRKCSKDLRGILLAKKTSTRGERQAAPFAYVRAERSSSGVAGGVLVGAAIVLVASAGAYAILHRGGAAVEAPSSAALALEKARKDADRALGLTNRPPESYEAACEVLRQVRELAEAAKGALEVEPKLKVALQRALRARDGFAPALAAHLVESAAAELKKADHPEEALAILDRFPKELSELPAAQDVAAARKSYEALLTCRRNAAQLLGLPAPQGFAEMDELMASPEAQACNFVQTDMGAKVEIERRRRRNAAIVNAESPPVQKDDIQLAAWYEYRFDLVEAESRFRAISLADPQNAEALMGLARIQLERDRLDLARPYAEQALRLSPNTADAKILAGWLEWLSSDNDSWERTIRLVAKVPNNWLGRSGRRLRWLFDLGRPLHELKHVRVFGRGVTADGTADWAADAESTAVLAARVLGVPDSDARLDVLLFSDDAERAKFTGNLELRKLTAEGVLLGCFAVTPPPPRDLQALRLAVAAGIARRAPAAAPDWLVQAVPYVIAGRPTPAPPRMKLAELERLDATAVLTREDAWASSLELASIIYSEEGRKAVSDYIDARREGATIRAREAFEGAYHRLSGR